MKKFSFIIALALALALGLAASASLVSCGDDGGSNNGGGGRETVYVQMGSMRYGNNTYITFRDSEGNTFLERYGITAGDIAITPSGIVEKVGEPGLIYGSARGIQINVVGSGTITVAITKSGYNFIINNGSPTMTIPF